MINDIQETKQKDSRAIPLQTIIFVMVAIGFIISFTLMFFMYQTSKSYDEMRSSTENYTASQAIAANLLAGSDELTIYARGFVVTGDPEQARLYYDDSNAQNAIKEAIEQVRLYSRDERILSQLDNAMQLRERLMTTEDYAMRLKVASMGDDIAGYPEKLQAVQLLPADTGLSAREQGEKARSLLFDIDYESSRNEISLRINKGMDVLMSDMLTRQVDSSDTLFYVLHVQQVLTVALMCTLLVLAGIVFSMVIIPLRRHITRMSNDQQLSEEGTSELRFLARTFNRLHAQNRTVAEKLNYEATHDGLTGLFNRSAYASMLDNLADKEARLALIEIDVDLFKQINDSYGHDTGDAVLKAVANNLKGSFREEEDMVCRIGGDEFAVIMSNIDSGSRDLILEKLRGVAQKLKIPDYDIPALSLSAGVSFTDQQIIGKGLFKTADLALYHIKNNGRNGVGFSKATGEVELILNLNGKTVERRTV
ncbi:MAG: GGDEF domain-containing protein [Lachnospiraceae bacterium]|nr:GGDEF domain-containing protein [Lachnospiraceae bacterium]